MSLTTFFAISFVVLLAAVVLLGIGYYRNFGEKAKAERKLQEIEAKQQQVKLEQTNAALDATITFAQNKQAELLQTVRNATNSITDLLNVVIRLESEMTDLKSNDAGRGLSPFPDLVAQAKKLYEDVAKDVPPVSEVVTRLEGARRIEQQLLASKGTAYAPDASSPRQRRIL